MLLTVAINPSIESQFLVCIKFFGFEEKTETTLLIINYLVRRVF